MCYANYERLDITSPDSNVVWHLTTIFAYAETILIYLHARSVKRN